jgi:hypothetical protein
MPPAFIARTRYAKMQTGIARVKVVDSLASLGTELLGSEVSNGFVLWQGNLRVTNRRCYTPLPVARQWGS